jgi:hypothetical protein
MKIFSALFGILAMGFTAPSLAAPETQISCIYDTVPANILSVFGKAAIGEEANQDAGLSSKLNVARNACIDIHGWTEAQAELAETYFGNRVARERVEQLVKREGVDFGKLARAYATTVKDDGKSQIDYKAALERENYPVYDEDMRKLADGYAQLFYSEQKAMKDFANSRTTAIE